MQWICLWLAGFLMHRIMYGIIGFGNRGEVASKEPELPKVTDIKLDAEQQKILDSIISHRVSEIKARYNDYDELKKFQQEQLQKQDRHQQEELEKSKKYEEAKKLYENQINQTKELVSKKDSEIQDLRINHALINEINKQNGYSEETLALIKQSAILDSNGSVTIKSKDANGMDTQLPVAEGIKKFLESRPYLIKSTHKAGAGSSGGTPPTGIASMQENLGDITAQYQDALNRRDSQKVKELTTKMRGQLHSKGVNL